MASRTVSMSPPGSYGWTNKIYLSPKDPLLNQPGRIKYIRIKDQYFVVEHHRSIGSQTLGMNAIQRQSLGVSSGEYLDCYPYTKDTSSAYSMKISLNRLDRKRNTMAVKSEKLEKVLQKVYHDQVFGSGQRFAADFNGTPLICAIEEMSCPDPNSTEEDLPIKMAFIAKLTKDTKISFFAPKKDIKIESESKGSNMFLDPNWKFQDMGIGGLDNEFSTIFRRAFSSRLLPKEILKKLGVQHTRGMLLFGPPGCGKTLIARQISKMLNAKSFKIVNGPSILSKFVGESEENIRKLFADADRDMKMKGEDSGLHIIILDELDAICKKRGSVNSGAGVHDTVVNQLLSKIDGVDSLNNILIIGMTNRKDMIDDALLRPGRLEVHVEIGLPDEKGRLQILKIHTHDLQRSQSLTSDVSLPELAALAKNFSGAELRGLVSNATTFATQRCIQYSKTGVTMTDPKNISVSMADFKRALEECKKSQGFGVEEDSLKNHMLGGLIKYGEVFNKISNTLTDLTKQVKESKATRLMSVLLRGPKGSGKTAIAANLALNSNYPFVKMITPVTFVGMSEMQKSQAIGAAFDSAYKTPLSMIIIDNIERMVEYIPIGPRFANHVLQTLMVLINRVPPKNSSVLVVCTCSDDRVLMDLSLKELFNVVVDVPRLRTPAHVEAVLTSPELELKISSDEVKEISKRCALPISIKQLLMVVEMTRVACPEKFTAEEFERRLLATGMRLKPKSIARFDGLGPAIAGGNQFGLGKLADLE
ncbi:hypothetical protein AAMO2058_000312800 [Amorphochlora amoebiformis]